MKRTHYEVLGVSPDASHDEIKSAWRKHQRKHHPDVAGPDEAEEFMAGTDAGTVLLDEQARAAYDESLRNPAPAVSMEKEPVVDEWIVEEEVVVVPDEPIRSETPAPDAEPSTVRIVTCATDWRVMSIAAFALPLIAAVCATNMRVAVIVALIMSCIGVLAGYGKWGVRSARTSIRKRPTTTTRVFAVLFGCLTAFGVMCQFLVLRSGQAPELTTVIPGVLIALAGGYLLGDAVYWMRFDSKIITAKALRESDLFGTEYGGANAAYLTDALVEQIGPNNRVFRLRDAFFSHMVVCGETVWLMRCVSGPNGHYRISGDSVLVTDSAGKITQVLASDLVGRLNEIRSVLPRRTHVEAVVAVNAQRVTSEASDVSVVALNDVASVINSRDAFIVRANIVDALLAMS